MFALVGVVCEPPPCCIRNSVLRSVAAVRSGCSGCGGNRILSLVTSTRSRWPARQSPTIFSARPLVFHCAHPAGHAEPVAHETDGFGLPFTVVGVGGVDHIAAM